MSSTNGDSSAPGGKSAVQVAAAQRFAEALVVGFEVCEQAGMPLTQIQRVALIEAALLQFDGFEAQVTTLSIVDEMLRDLGRNGREN